MFYHCSEFYMTAKFNPRTLTADCKHLARFNMGCMLLFLILKSTVGTRKFHVHSSSDVFNCLLIDWCAAFLINQSKAYMIAAAASWVEFWVEYFLFPSLKGRYT